MITLTAQQITFYKTNGYLELEDLFSQEESLKYDIAIQKSFETGPRDLWRHSFPLKNLLLSKNLSILALALTDQSTLRLGCDHLFTPDFSLKRPEKIKNLFSLQGIACTMIFQFQTGTCLFPSKPSPLGFIPFPHKRGNVVIVKPEFLLNWPPAQLPLYVAIYTLTNAIYIENQMDPQGPFLKQLGYGYGDLLKTDTHPILMKR